MSSRVMPTKKETIEYDSGFLDQWSRFCETEGLSKRHAAHAARIAFMELLTAEQREQIMTEALQFVRRSRRRTNSFLEL